MRWSTSSVAALADIASVGEPSVIALTFRHSTASPSSSRVVGEMEIEPTLSSRAAIVGRSALGTPSMPLRNSPKPMPHFDSSGSVGLPRASSRCGTTSIARLRQVRRERLALVHGGRRRRLPLSTVVDAACLPLVIAAPPASRPSWTFAPTASPPRLAAPPTASPPRLAAPPTASPPRLAAPPTALPPLFARSAASLAAWTMSSRRPMDGRYAEPRTWWTLGESNP